MPTFHAPAFDPIVLNGIGAIAILVAIAFVAIVTRGRRSTAVYKVAAIVALVMTVSALLAASGVLARTDLTPPPMAIMIGSVFAMAFVVGFSRLGRLMAADIPLVALIGLQMFRLPLELVMHHAANVGIMPHALSYSGYNFDILTGIAAVILFALIKLGVNVPLVVIWLWNLLGIYCLIAIAMIAIATSPMVHALGTEPHSLNTWVLHVPYVWLPVVLVTVAMISHIVITRQLLSVKRAR